ncbi:CRISPR-associated protein Csd2 [Deinobacterium chartae]|uniref:CRISPR-associated protein Csd2 n=1 Tax=Deinobacterium chartae TaxID=521158 RepID=A0A841HVC7_9DEIO|nr:type I-C CRISPR-associated protein Cas7/Csd2 [Deinobacterium chartae]MBB6096614.1 CRISPR-associated protein Csd2 [Deinobacterium chartae]
MKHLDPNLRHDFVLLFDVTDGNPNGDPDGGNAPRTDPETLQGLVTDVALKRKVRNFVEVYSQALPDEEAARYKIFVEHHGVLNDQIRRAYLETGIALGKPVSDPNPSVPLETLEALIAAGDLPSSFSVEDGTLHYNGELDETGLKALWEDLEGREHVDASVIKYLQGFTKKSGKVEKNRADAEKAQRWMTANFFDVRMFGAVMSTGLNAGQVRGPLQLTFARSIDPVEPQDLAITRVAVTDAKDREKLQTMGRKNLIPYGLYRAHGFFSPHLARGTGVTSDDLRVFWDALVNMWDLDRSASRGYMAVRGLYVFTHDRPLGNAPAHKLFERIEITRDAGSLVPRRFSDYTVTVLDADLPEGVTLTRLLLD